MDRSPEDRAQAGTVRLLLHWLLKGRRKVVLNPLDLLARQICRFAGCAGGGGGRVAGREVRGVGEGEGRPCGKRGGVGLG